MSYYDLVDQDDYLIFPFEEPELNQKQKVVIAYMTSDTVQNVVKKPENVLNMAKLPQYSIVNLR